MLVISNTPTPSAATETSFAPSRTTLTKSVKETAVIARPRIEKQWAVVYNSEVDITFVHAFNPASLVYVLAPIGIFLLNYDLGRTEIYDDDLRSFSFILAPVDLVPCLTKSPRYGALPVNEYWPPLEDTPVLSGP
jgi:hypothetical protein